MEANQDYSRNMTMKGKRTKRPRPSSPLSLTMVSTSSTTTTSAATTAADGDRENPNHTFDTKNTSIEFTKIVRENDEEEEMANCLILLAQSQSGGYGSSQLLPPPTGGAVEVARTSGYYVYECKTCNRGFSSFQALGGHRASHKKPSNPNMLKQDVDVHHSSIELSLHIGSSQTSQSNPSGSIKVTKIHICSICKAEFGSGQALGGHMRRHRSMPVARTDCGDSNVCQESKKSKTLLSLDLNLPAPVEDDPREKKFRYRFEDQMIMFSNSSLVHCHN